MIDTARLATSVLLLEAAGRSRDLRAMTLMTHGYDIDCTASTAQAWRMWKTKRPDLVLVALDVHDKQLLGVVEKIRHSHISQSVRFLRPRLCSLYIDGDIVQCAMPSDDVLVAAEAHDLEIHGSRSARASAGI